MSLNKDYLDSLTTVNAVDYELRVRQNQIDDCVGKLYPSILGSEVDQLLDRRSEIMNLIPAEPACV